MHRIEISFLPCSILNPNESHLLSQKSMNFTKIKIRFKIIFSIIIIINISLNMNMYPYMKNLLIGKMFLHVYSTNNSFYVSVEECSSLSA